MLKKKDMQIIAHLRRDARMPITTVSRITNIPVSTIFDRLKLHEGGLITKYAALLDFNKAGYSIRSKISIKVDDSARLDVKNYLIKSENVNSLYTISNGFDFLFEVIFKNTKELEDFINKLESKFNIKDKHIYHVVNDIKRESFLPE